MGCVPLLATSTKANELIEDFLGSFSIQRILNPAFEMA